MSLTTAMAQPLNLSSHLTSISGGHQAKDYQEPSLLLEEIYAQPEDECLIISFLFLNYKINS